MHWAYIVWSNQGWARDTFMGSPDLFLQSQYDYQKQQCLEMARGGEKSQDFYAVLGLKKECSASQLKDAYWKLAKRWHPDRCSALGNLKSIEESKEKFQAIQHAYSVLSDENKRFLYGVGVYKSDDDETGMADFLNEMGVMMSQNDSKENGESLEDLQELFDEIFQGDMEALGNGDSI